MKPHLSPHSLFQRHIKLFDHKRLGPHHLHRCIETHCTVPYHNTCAIDSTGTSGCTNTTSVIPPLQLPGLSARNLPTYLPTYLDYLDYYLKLSSFYSHPAPGTRHPTPDTRHTTPPLTTFLVTDRKSYGAPSVDIDRGPLSILLAA